MNAQALDLLLAVTSLRLISFVIVGSQGAGQRLCGQVDQLIQQAARRSITENQTIIIAKNHAPTIFNCRDLNSVVRLDTERVGRKIKATVSTCPNVLKVVMYINSPGFFLPAAANMKTFSCSGLHNTLLIQPPIRRVKFIATVRPSTTFSSLYLSWMYQYTFNTSSTKWSQVQEQLEFSGTPFKTLDDINSTSDLDLVRQRRSQNMTASLTDKVCGKDKSCVRFGNSDCSHQQCDYHLTYSIRDLKYLDLEISGKAADWVALGLSSDDKMGGDGVIVCKKKSKGDKELEAVTMWINLAHTRPIVIDNMNTLVAHNSTDGHIYCKMTSSLLMKGTDSDTSLDLTNNWFQFYAKGELDRTGLMLKHSQTPPTSVNTISMLRHVNFYSKHYKHVNSSSCSSLSYNFLFICLSLVYLAITFVCLSGSRISKPL